MEEQGFFEISGAIASGVYALCWHGEVMYIGQSRTLMVRLAGYVSSRNKHRRVKLGAKWIRGIVFNEVWIRPCPLSDLDELEEAMIRLYMPKYNERMKTPLALNDLIAVLVPSAPKPPSEPIRRRV